MPGGAEIQQVRPTGIRNSESLQNDEEFKGISIRTKLSLLFALLFISFMGQVGFNGQGSSIAQSNPYNFPGWSFLATETAQTMPTPGLKRQRLSIRQVVCFAPTGGDVFYKDQPRCQALVTMRFHVTRCLWTLQTLCSDYVLV